MYIYILYVLYNIYINVLYIYDICRKLYMYKHHILYGILQWRKLALEN